MCHKMGRPPISTIGFGLTYVSSIILVPVPPANMTAFMFFLGSEHVPPSSTPLPSRLSIDTGPITFSDHKTSIDRPYDCNSSLRPRCIKSYVLINLRLDAAIWTIEPPRRELCEGIFPLAAVLSWDYRAIR